MELYQLRYFHVVADLGGLRAADHLVVSQSAVSRAIASLEAEIGVPLFTRQGRVNVLNRYGNAFRESTAEVARSIDAGVAAVRHLAGATGAPYRWASCTRSVRRFALARGDVRSTRHS